MNMIWIQHLNMRNKYKILKKDINMRLKKVQKDIDKTRIR